MQEVGEFDGCCECDISVVGFSARIGYVKQDYKSQSMEVWLAVQQSSAPSPVIMLLTFERG